MNISHKSSRSDKMKDWHRKQKKPPPLPSPGFQVLPPEIMIMVMKYLCVTDLICFSYSCKYALACVKFILGPHKPRLCQHPGCFMFDWPARIYSLMSRLEKDTGLRFCGWCFKLHPFSPRRALRVKLGIRVKPCCPLREVGGSTLLDPGSVKPQHQRLVARASLSKHVD
jgi:hypothetical protein